MDVGPTQTRTHVHMQPRTRVLSPQPQLTRALCLEFDGFLRVLAVQGNRLTL